MRRTRASEPSAVALAVAIAAAVGLSAVPLRGEEPKAQSSSSDPKASTSGKVNLNEVEIHGELEKPKIFFILPKAKREALNKERRFRFYPDILEPLDKDRFEEEARVLYQHGIPAE